MEYTAERDRKQKRKIYTRSVKNEKVELKNRLFFVTYVMLSFQKVCVES